MSRPVVLVIGAGPGVSGSLARRYAHAGYDVALAGLDEAVLSELAQELGKLDVDVGYAVVDITDSTGLTAAVKRFGDHTGRIDVVHFNPSRFRDKDPLSLTPDELADDVRMGVGSLLTAVQAARPYLSAGGRITATGSMAADVPSARAASLGVQKAGLRNLVISIDATTRADGIRAVSVTVRGTLAKEGPFTPDRVAEALFAAAAQDEHSWKTEIAYEG